MLFILLITFLLAIPLHSQYLNTIMITRLTAIGFLLSLLISWNSFIPILFTESFTIYSGLFNITTVSVGIEVLIFLIAGLICLTLPLINTTLPRELSLIFIFTTLGGTLLISSANLISLFLCLELQSFAIYVLATLDRTSESGTSAGLMYFLLGALASCLILLGSGLIYTVTGSLNLNDLEEFKSEISLGITILTIGCLFKIAAAPFHNWSITVYDNIPTVLVSWLAVVPKISILILLIHLSLLNTSQIILVSALLSIMIGSLLGLSQNRIKRLLAYSSVSHVGFMLLALSIGTFTAITGLILYLIQYSLTALILFLILISLSYQNRRLYDILNISELKSLFLNNPLIAVSLSICFFSMAGVPFLIGFFAKLEVLNASIQSQYYIIAIIAIIMSVISAVYYLNIIQLVYDTSSPSHIKSHSRIIELESNLAYVISLLSLVLLTYIINPLLWMNPIHLIMFNYTI